MSIKPEISDSGLEKILYALHHQYGYDFSHYAKASLIRRIQKLMSDKDVDTVEELCMSMSDQPDMFQCLLDVLTVNVTEMFRDPVFFRVLRMHVLPILASYPSIKVWHAGCATGEEVYAMCILLHEAGLLHRSRIYATDINPANLEKAAAGIMPLHYMQTNTINYQLSGGEHDFSDYYTALYDIAIIKKEFRERVVFQQHSLVTDESFNEFQLILCRNVLIYFDKHLQNRAIGLFHASLSSLGFLALGMKESLLFYQLKEKFTTMDAAIKLFRKAD